PGVGRYTAGAVLSIGFGVGLAVLDGNVARVLARLAALPLSIRRPRDAKRLWAMAEAWLPAGSGGGRSDPGEWDQALVELGAGVCTRRARRCGGCPLRRRCLAFAAGRPEAFPPAASRRAAEHVRRAVVLVERAGRMLVVKRQGPLLNGLWEPPGVEIGSGEP